MNESMNKFIKKLKQPACCIQYISGMGIFDFLPDKMYLKFMYRISMGNKLNLQNPKTFNEKMQWLKLNDRNPQYTTYVDKYKVREYIANVLGPEYLIPLLGVWEDEEEIDFDLLPNQFVLKCNHNSGKGMYICKDKSTLNIKQVKKNLKKGLKQNYYYLHREWPYKNIKPLIIAEKYMVDESGTELKDYKFMCFHGKVKCCFVCTERFSGNGLKVTFFDCNWKRMNIVRKYPQSDSEIKKPNNYEKMIEIAEKLSMDFAFVRIDLYNINGHVYFGEFSLYPGTGMEKFSPEKWDDIMGSWI